MVAERLMLVAWIVVPIALAISLFAIVWVIHRNHQVRKHEDQRDSHERLTDDYK